MSLIDSQSAYDILDAIPPERIETASLLSKQPEGPALGNTLASASSSAYAAAVPWTVRRKPTGLDIIAILGGSVEQQWETFQAFQLNGQTVPPKVFDRWVDDVGVAWDIKRVTDKFFAEVWDTDCLIVPGPACPLSLAVVPNSTNSDDDSLTTFTWAYAGPNVAPTSYTIQSSSDGVNFNGLSQPNVLTTSYVDTDGIWPNNADVWLQVIALTGSLQSLPSSAILIRAATTCTASSGSSITVSATVPSGGNGVYYWQTSADDGVTWQLNPFTGASGALTNLSAGSYLIQVQWTDANGNPSFWSDQVSATVT